MTDRDAVPHNLIAHPLLVLWPRVGRWLHGRTSPTAPTWRRRIDAARESRHAAGRSPWWDPWRCR